MKTNEFRVYGPPGCGKTTYVAASATELANRYGEDLVSICSLTRTAVGEASGRVIPLAEGHISTLHARCKRSLQAGPPAESRIGEFVRDVPEYRNEQALPKSLLRRAPRSDSGETTVDEVILAGGRQPSLYERAQMNRQQLIPAERWTPEVRRFHLVWSEWMAANGTMDFTGWLEAAIENQSLPPQQVVFVDEAQDHTPLQLQVIRTWRAKNRILVGDDDQNLYEWSGARPEGFFLPELPEGREKVLSQSYRVPREVHGYAMQIAHRISRRREKLYHPRPADGAVFSSGIGLNQIEAGGIPDSFLDSPGSSMFLTTCSYHLDPILADLRQRGIPFYNPYRRSNNRWNPLGDTLVANVLRAYTRPADGEPWTGNEVSTWAAVLASGSVFRDRRKSEFLTWCAARGSEPVTVEDMRPWVQPFALERLRAGDLSIFVSDRLKGAHGDWEYGVRVFRLPEEERTPKVIVGTIHSVKGGEADQVYLWPDLSPAGYRDLTGANRDRLNRLFYVAVTRARDTLIVGRSSGRYAYPLPRPERK